MYGYECNGYCGGNAVVSLRSQYYEGGYYLYMYTTDTWQKQFYALTDFNDSKIRAL